jgi:hypothetical protein
MKLLTRQYLNRLEVLRCLVVTVSIDVPLHPFDTYIGQDCRDSHLRQPARVLAIRQFYEPLVLRILYRFPEFLNLLL